MSAPEDQENDQSMEEILQSIKRIIAEEEPEEGADAPAAEDAAPMQAEAAAAEDEDVLELTDMVNGDGTVNKVGADTPALEDEFVMETQTEPAPAPEPSPKAEPKVAPAVASDGLVSEAAAAASSTALEELLSQEPPAAPAPKKTSPSPQFRSGATVEDLVLEALRPMLKEWLDANLPTMVENMVRDEIKRLSPR